MGEYRETVNRPIGSMCRWERFLRGKAEASAWEGGSSMWNVDVDR